MAKVNICNVEVKDNPCPFKRPFQFEITFECIEDLNEGEQDLEWKIIYVGSAESEDYDQTLDTVVVGPIVAGRHMFVFEADPPDPAKIPREDIVGVTVVLLTCSYRSQEFVRVGYYVNNEYLCDSENPENIPLETDFDKLQRNILATCPRVTRFKIDWGDGEDGENCVPQNNTENSSNQMPVDGAPAQTMKEETMDGCLGKTESANIPPLVVNGGTILNAASADSNSMDVLTETTSLIKENSSGSEAMQIA